jgi:hypothetical protein
MVGSSELTIMVLIGPMKMMGCSVLPLPVSTGRPRPPLIKKSIDFDHEIMENEKKLRF